MSTVFCWVVSGSSGYFLPTNCQSVGSDTGQTALHRVPTGPRISRTMPILCQRCWALATNWASARLTGCEDKETQCLLLRSDQITETSHKQISTVHCRQCCWGVERGACKEDSPRSWRVSWIRRDSWVFSKEWNGRRAFQGKWLKLSESWCLSSSSSCLFGCTGS